MSNSLNLYFSFLRAAMCVVYSYVWTHDNVSILLVPTCSNNIEYVIDIICSRDISDQQEM